MGYEEKKVAIEIDGAESVGDALLEPDEILLRIPGEAKRRRLPLGGVEKLSARDGALSFTHGASRFVLRLGARAERWRTRIEHPPSLIDKLGIRAETRVHVHGVDAPELLAELAARGVTPVPLSEEVEVVVLGLRTARDLPALARTMKKANDATSLWAVWPKGQKAFGEDHIRASARASGLVDVKVARVSETLSGLLLVVPRASRRT